MPYLVDFGGIPVYPTLNDTLVQPWLEPLRIIPRGGLKVRLIPAWDTHEPVLLKELSMAPWLNSSMLKATLPSYGSLWITNWITNWIIWDPSFTD